MPGKKQKWGQKSALRSKAESVLRGGQSEISKMAIHDVQALVNELQVHQIELEIQNEELRRAQLDLASAVERYSDLYEFAPVGYVTVDKRGLIIKANLTLAGMLSRAREELNHSSILRFVDNASASECCAHLQAVFASDKKDVCELNLKTKKGALRPVRLEGIVERPATGPAERCRIAVIDISDLVATRGQLQQANEELRHLTNSLLVVQEEERRSLAYELHDDFGQRIVALEMEASHLASLLLKRKVAECREVLDYIRERIRRLAGDIRNASHRLHPSILEDFGLVAALQNLVGEFNGNGPVRMNLDEPSRSVPAGIALALFRIAQEALQNVAKHATGAQVCVSLHETDLDLVLTVEDNGPGFDLEEIRARTGLGLLSMRERARQISGYLRIQTDPGSGTLLTVRIPRKRPANRDRLEKV